MSEATHGMTAYRKGCRCGICLVAHARRCKDYQNRALAQGGSTTVPVGEARDVLIEMSERMSWSAIAREIGTSHAWIGRVIRGQIKRTDPKRHRDIMAMTRHRPTDTSHVSSLGTIRRLRALHAMGWTWIALAEKTGYSLTGLKSVAEGKWDVVEAKNAEAVRKVYEALSLTLPTSDVPHQKSAIGRARNAAKKKGWVPPLMWDNPDDPDENPKLPRTASDAPEERVDQVYVERVINGGERTRRLTHAEATQVVRRLLADGVSTYRIEKSFGLKPERYTCDTKGAA